MLYWCLRFQLWLILIGITNFKTLCQKLFDPKHNYYCCDVQETSIQTKTYSLLTVSMQQSPNVFYICLSFSNFIYVDWGRIICTCVLNNSVHSLVYQLFLCCALLIQHFVNFTVIVMNKEYMRRLCNCSMIHIFLSKPNCMLIIR